ncbi:MAG: hypothetical protein EA340_14645 [Nitriliruptor sp.]|nr:MAG: hypothetical protein EA340_14645 [Nitriliruptor sp.]
MSSVWGRVTSAGRWVAGFAAAAVVAVKAPVVLTIAGVVLAAAGTAALVVSVFTSLSTLVISASEATRYTWRVVDDFDVPEGDDTMDRAQQARAEWVRAMEAGAELTETARGVVDPTGSVLPSLSDWQPEWVSDAETVQEAAGKLWGWGAGAASGPPSAGDDATQADDRPPPPAVDDGGFDHAEGGPIVGAGIAGPLELEVGERGVWMVLVSGGTGPLRGFVSWDDLERDGVADVEQTGRPLVVERTFEDAGFYRLRVVVLRPGEDTHLIEEVFVEVTGDRDDLPAICFGAGMVEVVGEITEERPPGARHSWWRAEVRITNTSDRPVYLLYPRCSAGEEECQLMPGASWIVLDPDSTHVAESQAAAWSDRPERDTWSHVVTGLVVAGDSEVCSPLLELSPGALERHPAFIPVENPLPLGPGAG